MAFRCPICHTRIQKRFFIHKKALEIHDQSAVPGHAGKIEFSGQILSIVIQKLVDFLKKRKKRNYNTRSKTFNVIFCFVITKSFVITTVRFISGSPKLKVTVITVVPKSRAYDCHAYFIKWGTSSRWSASLYFPMRHGPCGIRTK